MIDLAGTPYVIAGAAEANLAADLGKLAERIALLRSEGKLTAETLERYYGQTRFEQIAESNAIEGSTLSAGETQLAVLKGITITGHDPKYARDARHLAAAMERLQELARSKASTDIAQVKELHELILGGGPVAGTFRKDPVRIAGAKHQPPTTWKEVMDRMEDWEQWSQSNPSAPPVLRSVVLHAWLTHIHPFLDGNGRTARAIGNLELIRAGYPPIIIKKTKHRERYLSALADSDEGNLAAFIDLILGRVDDAVRDLVQAAIDRQGHSEIAARVRQRQELNLAVWNAGVDLLATLVASELTSSVQGFRGETSVQRFRDALDLPDYLSLCESRAIHDAWAFRIECRAPGLPPVTRLAWLGFRSDQMKKLLPRDAPAAPSVFWSELNRESYPPWKQLKAGAPGGEELTLVGDRWFVRNRNDVKAMQPTELALAIAKGVSSSLIPDP